MSDSDQRDEQDEAEAVDAERPTASRTTTRWTTRPRSRSGSRSTG